MFWGCYIWTRLKGVSFHVTVICKGKLERLVLLKMEELWEEEWIAAVAKSSAKEGFVADLPGL